MNPAISKTKWKKNNPTQNLASDHSYDDFPHAHVTRPKEKLGKRKFKLQREVDDYLLSIH